MALGLTQPLTGIVPGIFTGGGGEKGRPPARPTPPETPLARVV